VVDGGEVMVKPPIVGTVGMERSMYWPGRWVRVGCEEGGRLSCLGADGWVRGKRGEVR
jgi:hypothetical protein